MRSDARPGPAAPAPAPERILHIKQGEWSLGGVETFLLTMFRNVDRSLVSFDVLTIGSDPRPGVLDAEINALGGRRLLYVEHGSGPSLGKLGPLHAVYDRVRRNGYDTVHIHTGSRFHGFYAWAARLAGARTVVMHSHTVEGADLPVPLRRLLDVVVRLAPTHWFACSPAAARWLFPASVQPAVRIVRNGIELDAYRFDADTRARLRAELGFADDQLVVGHVGRFSHEKNHPLLLRAFHALVDAGASDPTAQLVCVGDGDDLEAMKSLAAQLGITGQVHFLGVRRDVPELLQAMDVFVLPSFGEGFGIAAIEAQAAGLACVCSTGVPEDVDATGRCRFLSVDDPPAGWAEAVRNQVALSASVPRAHAAQLVSDAGYDARRCARELQAFYLRDR